MVTVVYLFVYREPLNPGTTVLCLITTHRLGQSQPIRWPKNWNPDVSLLYVFVLLLFFYLKGFRIGFLEVSSFKALENENLKQKSAISQKFDSTVVKLLLTSCKIISTEFKFFFYCLGLLMHNDYNLFFFSVLIHGNIYFLSKLHILL